MILQQSGRFSRVSRCGKDALDKSKNHFLNTHTKREKVLDTIEQSNSQWEKFRGHLGWGWRGGDWEGQGGSPFVFCVSA